MLGIDLDVLAERVRVAATARSCSAPRRPAMRGTPTSPPARGLAPLSLTPRPAPPRSMLELAFWPELATKTMGGNAVALRAIEIVNHFWGGDDWQQASECVQRPAPAALVARRGRG